MVREAEEPRCLRLVAAGASQRVVDELALERLDAAFEGADRLTRAGARKLEIGRGELAVGFAVNGALDDVLQLADVAGEGVVLQRLDRVGREPLAGELRHLSP